MHLLNVIFDSHLYWYLSGLVWALPAYFRGKTKGYREVRAVYDPLVERLLESNADSVKLLCSVRDEMKRSGITYYFPHEDEQPPTKPTEH